MRKIWSGMSALLVAGSTLAVAAPAQADTTRPEVIHTVASDAIGGLPIKSLDGTKEYIPQAPARSSLPNAARTGTPAHRAENIWPTGATGYDISWPQCPAHNPVLPPDSDVAVVGVNDGTPFTALPCIEQQLAWSPNGVHAQYMILDSPIGSTTDTALQYAYHGPAGNCASDNYYCQAFNWGWNAANYSIQIATAAGATSNSYWLDVELPTATSINQPGPDCYAANFWTCDPKVNSTIVTAAIAALTAQHKQAGVYSTQLQWGKITNGFKVGLPIWIAGWSHPGATYCDPANASSYWFGGGKPWLVQGLPTDYDPDTAC
ncbi:hypothetical protein Airi02_074100 [Actinoallomurus iriomotensis]|uniref:Secreted protein n=2 Tax=Actinoallomurus iriomotensis TaxID=478107 RepID=A0A9W6W4Y5_9ACTN|nr:hypothetical protein Airi02_074100 [Actinoallomurus iriomotensis]